MKKYILLFLFAFAPCLGNSIDWPSFDEAMECVNRYQPEFVSAQHWNLSKKQYDDFITHPNYQATPKIPKIIHQVWLGSPLPKRCQQLQASWKENHPDWEYKLWTEAEIKELGLKNQRLYDQATNLGEKSDIARYEILYRLGGLYVDTDFECLKSFDYLHHTCTFYSGFLYPKIASDFLMANGLIAASPHHPVIKDCIDTMKRTDNDNSAMAIINRSGPIHLSRCYKKHLIENTLPENSIILPTNFLYAFPAWERFEPTKQNIENWIKPYSFALHYWHTSWQKKSILTYLLYMETILE